MPRKPKVMLSELAFVWDSDPSVRACLRSEPHAALSYDGPAFKATVSSCSENMDLLLPVLDLTKETLMLNII